MNLLIEAARALRSGAYRDCRKYAPEEKHDLLKQTVWSENDGAYVPVYSALGVIADVCGVSWIATTDGDFVCKGDIESKTEFYDRRLGKTGNNIAYVVDRLSIQPTDNFRELSFAELAEIIERKLPFGERFGIEVAA